MRNTCIRNWKLEIPLLKKCGNIRGKIHGTFFFFFFLMIKLSLNQELKLKLLL